LIDGLAAAAPRDQTKNDRGNLLNVGIERCFRHPRLTDPAVYRGFDCESRLPCDDIKRGRPQDRVFTADPR
jgi:hypothetical protein